MSTQQKSTYIQYSLYGIVEESMRQKLINQLKAMTPHPILTYDHNHVITLHYNVQKQVQGRSKREMFDIKLYNKSRDPTTLVRWAHDIRKDDSIYEVKVINECIFFNGQALWFLQSMGATLKNEFVECNVSEFQLENGIEVRLFQLGKCEMPLDLHTVKLINESGRIYIVEIRGVAQQTNEYLLEKAMQRVLNDLKSTKIQFSKRSA